MENLWENPPPPARMFEVTIYHTALTEAHSLFPGGGGRELLDLGTTDFQSQI